MTTFVDTSALLAVADRADVNHAQAKALWQKLLESNAQLLTTNYVLVETTALVQHRYGLDALRALAHEVLPALEIEWVGPDDHAAAMAAVLASDRRRLSLVDCTSFEVLRRLGISSAFAFDRHFAELGFELLA
jgi:predicted nucleic acid-binding protein